MRHFSIMLRAAVAILVFSDAAAAQIVYGGRSRFVRATLAAAEPPGQFNQSYDLGPFNQSVQSFTGQPLKIVTATQNTDFAPGRISGNGSVTLAQSGPVQQEWSINDAAELETFALFEARAGASA